MEGINSTSIIHLPNECPGKRPIYEIIKVKGHKGYLLSHVRCASNNWQPCTIVREKGHTVVGWIFVEDMVRLLKAVGFDESMGEKITQSEYAWMSVNGE